MDFRAHISDDGREQSVKEHCEAVSELCREYCKKIGLENLCSLEGLSHDGGKLCGDFNNYIAGNSSFSRGEIDHSFAGAKYLSDLCTKIECKAIKKIAARVICSHHGLQDWLNENSENTLVKRLDKKDRWDEIEENIKATFDERATIELIKKANEEYVAFKNRLFEWCKENYPDVKTEAKGFFLFLLERMLLSMLVSADRGDTADFMAGEKLGISYDNNSVFSGMEDKIEEINKAFSTLTDPISLKRQDISNRCKAFFDNKRSIVRLVVPTGGGKTLSSMRFAASYCKKFSKDRIIYTAPFMSILEQNSDTIRGLMPDESLYLEHHSDILSTMGSGNDLELYELRTERWDNPVISTTLVQLLNTLFSGKMSSVARMHRLCNSVIIIDEVQSIPIKCIYMFNMAMSFLAEFCNTTVVLCSATQPSLEDIKYNQINFTRYEAEYNRLLMPTPYDYEKLTRNSIVTAKDFRKIEYKECEKIKLKPVCSILVKVNARYVSPQGRNSYTRTFTFKTGDIVSFFNDYTNAQKYKQSKQYQRSLMTDKLRYKIMKRDNFRCVICGASQKDGVKLHVDHIIPVSKGGKTIESNLRTLCDRCNLGKGASYDPNGVN